MTSYISPSILSETISWGEYLATARGYVGSPDRPDRYSDEKMLKYTAENLVRMDHVLQATNIGSKLYNLLTAIDTDLIWVVLTEPWCGDASQVVPVLYTIASCSGRISFRILQSDAHPEVLDRYLTGQGRSIPKLICLRAGDMEELGTWGPRPAGLQKIVIGNKDNPDLSFGAKVRMVHDWYAQDKTASIQHEFIDLIRKWTGKE
jgi:hypothetical protein